MRKSVLLLPPDPSPPSLPFPFWRALATQRQNSRRYHGPSNPGTYNVLECKRPPNPGMYRFFSAQGGPHTLEYTVVVQCEEALKPRKAAVFFSAKRPSNHGIYNMFSARRPPNPGIDNILSARSPILFNSGRQPSCAWLTLSAKQHNNLLTYEFRQNSHLHLHEQKNENSRHCTCIRNLIPDIFYFQTPKFSGGRYSWGDRPT